MSYEDQEYHRRRAEMELDQVLSAGAEESALAHLTLARLHRARRQSISEPKMNVPARRGIFGTDKES